MLLIAALSRVCSCLNSVISIQCTENKTAMKYLCKLSIRMNNDVFHLQRAAWQSDIARYIIFMIPFSKTVLSNSLQSLYWSENLSKIINNLQVRSNTTKCFWSIQLFVTKNQFNVNGMRMLLARLMWGCHADCYMQHRSYVCLTCSTEPSNFQSNRVSK